MSRRMIVAEENPDILNVLQNYFQERDYHVQGVQSAPAVLEAARTAIPSLIIFSGGLPNANPEDLVQQLRAMPRTSHVPIICLAPRDRYAQLLHLLEAGADDCIAKPFDMEELALRVENAVNRNTRENMIDPRSGLPGARLLQDYLGRLGGTDGWSYLELRIEHFEPFREVNGFVAADQVLQMVPGLLRESILAQGTEQDYLSHPADDFFVLITFAQAPDALVADMAARFSEATQAHYSFMDREMGFLTVQRGEETVQVPLMSLSAASVPREQLYGSA